MAEGTMNVSVDTKEETQNVPEVAEELRDETSDSDSDSDSDESSESEVKSYTLRPKGEPDIIDEDDNSPENNIRLFMDIHNAKWFRREQEEEEEDYEDHEDLFDFPEDPENWREEDLKELWADGPIHMTKPGWDPSWVDEEEMDFVREEIKAGRDPPIAPFYLPYRKYYPAIPDDHFDISDPKSVIEELDRIEEFLKWVSYIFSNGSSYEGTVWDDLAHGKGVYVAEQGLVRYEGEWLQNAMEGHGVVEVDIPDIEPFPGSKLEAKMRAEGKIIKRDFMSPEDREWLEKDIEDSIQLAGGTYEIPFYENEEWIRQFGKKPEKGRYRYAGEWKHGRMHGCGVYEVNERTIYGRFYFGEMLQDPDGCDDEISALHAGLAEVAAAKARMFINKPDGMVREERGPYNDPQHPYLYEEDDVWMAPGFINQFYEVPDYWKTYVHEVDQEREMWLNSFYKAPLRLPMPAELEYWWSKDDTPEFVLINKEPEPDPEDPSKLIYTEDPLILHTTTGRIINYIDDEEYGVRLFWQPPPEESGDVDPDKAVFLPLGFDEFYGRVVDDQDNIWKRLLKAVENACKPILDKLEKWTEEKQKDSELKIQLIEKEYEMAEAQLCLKETIEDMDEALKKMQKEEERKVESGLLEEEDLSPAEVESQFEKTSANYEEEDEDEDDAAPTSFGSVVGDEDSTKVDRKGNNDGKSPFATSSLSFASCSFFSMVPSKLQQSFSTWKLERPQLKMPSTSSSSSSNLSPTLPDEQLSCSFVSFTRKVKDGLGLRAVRQRHHPHEPICTPHLSSLKQKSFAKTQRRRSSCSEEQKLNILSLQGLLCDTRLV